ncbi:hypothetical protein AB0G74_30660 [Streptomyces sp. NPDC020875]|uniref:STAS domain-containing protein n=1 Tax=Streptomyces sp. NPDC020875 TaxID=3154898 RepID=UPI0033DA9A19
MTAKTWRTVRTVQVGDVWLMRHPADGGTVVVTIGGELTLDVAKPVRDLVSLLLTEAKVKKRIKSLVLDLRPADYVVPRFVIMIVDLQKEASAQGTGLEIVVGSRARRALEKLRFLPTGDLFAHTKVRYAVAAARATTGTARATTWTGGR